MESIYKTLVLILIIIIPLVSAFLYTVLKPQFIIERKLLFIWMILVLDINLIYLYYTYKSYLGKEGNKKKLT